MQIYTLILLNKILILFIFSDKLFNSISDINKHDFLLQKVF